MSKKFICPECGCNVKEEGFSVDLNLSYTITANNTLEQTEGKFMYDYVTCNACGLSLGSLSDELLELMKTTSLDLEY